jgi:hypothetical protein
MWVQAAIYGGAIAIALVISFALLGGGWPFFVAVLVVIALFLGAWAPSDETESFEPWA